MQQVMRFWFLATAIVLVGAMVWAFVPVLVPMLAVAAGLGGLVAVMVAMARKLERWRDRA